MKCRNHPLSSNSFSSKNCSKTWSATAQVPLAAGRVPLGAAAHRQKGVNELHGSGDHASPKQTRARNTRFGFCSSEQIFFGSLCIYLFVFLGEAGEYHTSIFLPQHSWWEKQFRKSVFSLRVTEAGQAFRTDRQLVLIHHLLVSRLWTTTSSPAVLHAQVPSGRRFLRVMRSGETPIQLRGNPTSGLPLSQTFICLFNAQELCFISVLLIVQGIYTSNQKPFFLTSPLSFLSVRRTFAKKRGGKGQPILRENASVILTTCAGTDFKQVRTSSTIQPTPGSPRYYP